MQETNNDYWRTRIVNNNKNIKVLHTRRTRLAFGNTYVKAQSNKIDTTRFQEHNADDIIKGYTAKNTCNVPKVSVGYVKVKSTPQSRLSIEITNNTQLQETLASQSSQKGNGSKKISF